MAGGVETLKSAFSAVTGTVKFAGKVIGKVPLVAGVSTLVYTFGKAALDAKTLGASYIPTLIDQVSTNFDTMKTLFSDLQTAYTPAPA